jgi:transcriptional regulator with XRE-family HTH domain
VNLSDLANRIKAWRESARLTQEQLAKALGVTSGAVCRWERGYNGPQAARLNDIAAACGVTMEGFLTRWPRRRRRKAA